MQCPKCQQDNPDTARFCNGCGARLEAACPECEQTNPPGSRFCNACGFKLTGTAGTAPVLAPTTPEAYTPKHLAERILTSRAALEGERKQVTVLFADLKGSMELLADRDPEEARAILDPVLERMMEAVHRYEGTVNQVMGDGIMALFGAPLAHEDHAVRACYAALSMQEAIRAHAAAVRRDHGVEVQVRIGLNSGEVIVRAIGNDLHMDYSAIGATTHLAARMEQLATPGTIRLTPETLRLVEGLVQVQSLGPVPVKGLAEPIEVYELLGTAPTRSRLQAAAVQGLTRFVGRDAELETLRRTLDQAAAGHGQLVALVGEPGVGKSRLVWEFSQSHRTQGWLVLESRSVSYGKASPYLPVLDLLRAYCGIEARDDARRRREQVVGKLLSLDPALEPTLPALLALLDVPVEGAPWQALDPLQRRQRTLDALKRLLLRESQVQPLLLVFEDLHWIDSETQALLDSLVESLPTARVLLLVNYRPEYTHQWGGRTYYAQLRLDPLPPASAEELLAALLGDAAGLAPLKERLIARTEGNPFFLEESVRTLVETGVLVGERGAHRLAQPLATTQVPATVQAVLAARIDRLAPSDKHLLQTAAVIGRDVRFGLLQALGEAPERAMREGLVRLQGAEFLYETALFPDLEYTFKHALTHEVAYGSLPLERRRALHAQIVAAIETRYADRLTEQVERLAHHAVRGELWEQAVGYLRQAGEKAQAQSAHREAVAYLEQAIGALAHLPQDRATREMAIDLRLALRSSYLALGQLERVGEDLREAEAVARALNDHHRLAWVTCFTTHYLSTIGESDRAVERGQQALAAAGTLQDLPLGVLASHFLGQTYYDLGQYDQTIILEKANVAALQGELTLARFGMLALPSNAARAWLTLSFAEQGDFVAGIAAAKEAIQVAESADESFGLVGALSALGHLYLYQGDWDRAVPVFERCRDLCHRWHLTGQLPSVASDLGYGYALSGRLGEGIPLLEQSVNQPGAIRVGGRQSPWQARLSEAYLLAARLQEANDQARGALKLARERKQRGWEAWALRLLGEIAAQADPPHVEQAESYYHQALALAEELGMRPLVAHCHFGLGTLYGKIGRHEQAQAELKIAAEMYRAMEMPFWLEKAEAALVQVAG